MAAAATNIHKPRKDGFEIFAGMIKKQPKDFFKLAHTGAEWLRLVFVGLEDVVPVAEFRDVMRLADSSFSVPAVLSSASKTASKALKILRTGEGYEDFREAIFAGIWNVKKAASFLKKTHIMRVGSLAIKRLSVVGGFCFATNSIKSAFKEIVKINTDNLDSTAQFVCLLKAARSIGTFAIGLFAIIGAIFAPIASSIMLITGTFILISNTTANIIEETS